jgi:hypothetical protein
MMWTHQRNGNHIGGDNLYDLFRSVTKSQLEIAMVKHLSQQQA